MRVWILILFLNGAPQPSAYYYDTEDHCWDAAMRWHIAAPPPRRMAMCEPALLIEITRIRRLQTGTHAGGESNVQRTSIPSSTTHAFQPSRGARNSHAVPIYMATSFSCKAQSPVAGDAGM